MMIQVTDTTALRELKYIAKILSFDATSILIEPFVEVPWHCNHPSAIDCDLGNETRC